MSDQDQTVTEAWRAREADAASEIAAIVAASQPKEESPNVQESAAPVPGPGAADAAVAVDGTEGAGGTDTGVADPVVPGDAGRVDPDRGLLRLLEREGQVRDRESAVERREREAGARIAQLEDELRTTKSQAIGGDLEAAIAADPLEFFRSRGADPTQVSRLILAAALGNEAPPELRETMREYRYEKRIKELEARLERGADQQEIDRVRSGAEAHATKTDAAKHPTLAAVASKDPRRATDAIFGKIAEDARTRGLRRGDKLMSYEDAAAAVEADWGVFREALSGPVPAKADSTHAAPAATNAPQVGKSNNTTPPAPPKAAPPPRRNYWDPSDRDAEVQAALAEALAIAKGGART